MTKEQILKDLKSFRESEWEEIMIRVQNLPEGSEFGDWLQTIALLNRLKWRIEKLETSE